MKELIVMGEHVLIFLFVVVSLLGVMGLMLFSGQDDDSPQAGGSDHKQDDEYTATKKGTK